jgi:hypothetical protein
MKDIWHIGLGASQLTPTNRRSRPEILGRNWKIEEEEEKRKR